MDLIMTADFWIGLLTLTALEVVLGIDNLIFISIIASKAPQADQHKVRKLGLLAALVTRILLLMGLSFLMKLKDPLFSLGQRSFSLHDLILIAGGMFLLAKTTIEIYGTVENKHDDEVSKNGLQGKEVKKKSLGPILFQIMMIDIVFSFDSVITAVGMVSHISIW